MAAASGSGAVFELSGVDGQDEVLGIWQPVPGGPPVAFASGGARAPVVWRAHLPGPAGRAARELAAAEARLRLAREALSAAWERLDALLHTRARADVFFGPAALAAPEAGLVALLREMEGGPPVSFGARAGGERLGREFHPFLDRVGRFVAHHAWVETDLQGDLVGRTRVGWTGDAATAWAAPAGPGSAALHQRHLALALASRDTLMRTVLLAAQAAVKLSALLAAPGGALLALPAAWRFIQQVRAELQRAGDPRRRPAPDPPSPSTREP